MWAGLNASPRVIMAQIIRMFLFARATAAMFLFRRPIKSTSQVLRPELIPSAEAL